MGSYAHVLSRTYSCDADPAALSKYIVALLRKDKPRSSLKDLCIDQLEVFLAKGMWYGKVLVFKCTGVCVHLWVCVLGCLGVGKKMNKNID